MYACVRKMVATFFDRACTPRHTRTNFHDPPPLTIRELILANAGRSKLKQDYPWR
jgi:hypothetical protein